MSGRRQEDIRVKLPALMHLTRLGYRYLPRGLARRDGATNILTDAFRAAVERINDVRLTDGEFGELLEAIHRALALDDLGERFFEGLRNSWRGLRLLDFEHPENNTLQVMTELLYASGHSRFRPDITLLVNGLPLAFIEVKNRDPRGSVRSEYNRMAERSRKAELRRFINETQIMVFSNDAAYSEDALRPLQGAFYATAAYDDFVYHSFPEEEPEPEPPLAPLDAEEAALILRDNRLEGLAEDPAFRASLSPATPTHRLLTSLFHPRRLLFFLRYGIIYLEEEEADGRRRVSKQILRHSQLFTARTLEKHLQQTPGGGVLYVPGSSKAALAGLQIRCLQDYFAARSTRGAFFYLCDHAERLARVREDFLRLGFRIAEARADTLFPPTVLREDDWGASPMPLITLVNIQDYADVPLSPLPDSRLCRVYFLDEMRGGYAAGPSFLSRLRAADRQALLIAFSFSPAADQTLSGSTLLFAGRITGEEREEAADNVK